MNLDVRKMADLYGIPPKSGESDDALRQRLIKRMTRPAPARQPNYAFAAMLSEIPAGYRWEFSYIDGALNVATCPALAEGERIRVGTMAWEYLQPPYRVITFSELPK